MRHRTIQSVVILQGIVAVVSVVALFLSLTSVGSRIDEIQASRRAAGTDTCQLLRRLVYKAAPKTPAMQLRASQFLDATSLQDCHAYGRQITRTSR